MGSILAALSELQRAAVLGNARQGRGLSKQRLVRIVREQG